MSRPRRLRLALAPSIGLTATLLVLHAAAGASAAAVLPGIAGIALAGLFVALGAATSWSRGLLRSPSSVRALELAGPNVELELGSGVRIQVEIGPRRYVGRLMVVLRVQRPMRGTLLITRDMLDPEAFRLLRVWALWSRLPAVATKPLAA